MLYSMALNRLISAALIGAAVFVASGCESTTTSSSPRAMNNSANDQALTADQALNTDPSALRLDDIDGAMLLYYRDNQQMPPRLEDLGPYAQSVGITLNLVSPGNGMHYGYDANGMTALGATKLLVVYDPAPGTNGRRWCILMAPPHPGAALSAEVLDIPEFEFRSYLASER
jgi:hypothetical protein